MKSVLHPAQRDFTAKRFHPPKADFTRPQGRISLKKALLSGRQKALFSWRSGRDSNPRYAFDVHTISSRARYDRFDTTPYAIVRGGRPRFGSNVVVRSSLLIIYNETRFVNTFFRKIGSGTARRGRVPRPGNRERGTGNREIEN